MPTSGAEHSMALELDQELLAVDEWEGEGFWDECSQTRYRPCLGVTWAHCLHTRIICTTLPRPRNIDAIDTSDGEYGASAGASSFLWQHVAVVSKSPVTERCNIPYRIATAGIAT